jgi:hypothetical protein
MVKSRCLSALILVVCGCSSGCLAPKGDRPWKLRFDGSLVVDLSAPASWKVEPLKTSGGRSDAHSVVLDRDGFKTFLVVYARPVAWTDEILLNFMEQETAMHWQAYLAQYSLSSGTTLPFPDDETPGFYRKTVVTKEQSQKEVPIFEAGYVLGELWIHVWSLNHPKHLTPYDWAASLPSRISVSIPLASDFMTPDILSPVLLQVLGVDQPLSQSSTTQ